MPKPKVSPASPRKASGRNSGSAGQIQITFDAFVTDFYLPYAKTRKRSWQVDERIASPFI